VKRSACGADEDYVVRGGWSRAGVKIGMTRLGTVPV
jgi:hypothetical protein